MILYQITGRVVLMRKNVLDLTNYVAVAVDDLTEFLGKRVSFRLVSATTGDSKNGNRGKVGSPAYLDGWITTLSSLQAGESHFTVEFMWEPDVEVPGAVIVKNNHPTEFYIKSVTLLDVPNKGRVHFVCNSWVYPVQDRVFFANDTYLTSNIPPALRPYVEDELLQLRGDKVTGMLEEHHRVYDYAYYNDLGAPDNGKDYVRPVLGGSKDYPYPRRGRTGRRPTNTDPNTESRLMPLMSLEIYVPRDERFGHLKLSDFLAYAIKSLAQGLFPGLKGYLLEKQYNSFQEVLDLYYQGLPLPDISGLGTAIPFEMIKELLRTDGERLLKLPVPQIIQEDHNVWKTDEEFGREMLAGVNPVIIRRLEEFPPTSKLDPEVYGNQNSSITEAHIAKNLDGLTVDSALKNCKLFILDHHDNLMPYLKRINKDTGNLIYASRTLLYLKDDGTLKPLAIELSIPHSDGEQHGAVSTVFTPADSGVEHSIWMLAKAYVAVDDSGVHQLISHWLNTHAVIEPFVIATNRQLSVVHPIHKLLSPHYRDTMNINALARQILINADGVLEKTVFPGRYAMEMSSVIYKDWKLTEQGLPDDLIKRGIAIEDPSHPNKLRLLIDDYPYAVDGLAIWSAIEIWVNEYCSIYYPDDATVHSDAELQDWWKEVREVGHGDKKDESWWPKMHTIQELTKTCTTIIWVASALHAAVNFGQYPYAGYLPNRPTISRRFMPEPGTQEYEELKKNPDKVFLNTISGPFETVLGVTLIEILSRHASDEVYIGQRDTPEWTSDGKAMEAFNRFQEKLVEIEKKIVEMNQDARLKNRSGPAKVPYTLLYPNASDHTGVGGLTGKGIPNSVSI